MLQINVALPSGKRKRLAVPESSKVGDLKNQAQKSFEQGFLKLISPEGRILDSEVSLIDAKLGDDDHLTAVAVDAKLAVSAGAFALWLPGGNKILTWGDEEQGGDRNIKFPKKVEHVQGVKPLAEPYMLGTKFTAIFEDGSVVNWGGSGRFLEIIENDDFEVQVSPLPNIKLLESTQAAFAAILEDESVIAWGDARDGGDSSKVQDKLKHVQRICSTARAFAAILADGSIVTWGDEAHGGDSSNVQHNLKQVKQIQSTERAFAAILADGSVVTWGDPTFGGDSSEVQELLTNVQHVQGAQSLFTAILGDGSVVTWGGYGEYEFEYHFLRGRPARCIARSNSFKVKKTLGKVLQLQSTGGAFAAILEDGLVVTWGDKVYGGDSSNVQHKLKQVRQIHGNSVAFAAVLADGSVVTWGSKSAGGDSSKVQDKLKHVQRICSTARAFAAILADGSIVAWGDVDYGGDCSEISDWLRLF